MKKGFSMIELLVVILILGLLATLAVGLFSKQVEKARYAKARTTIAALELAINRYQIDVGTYPPSGTGNLSGPTSSDNYSVNDATKLPTTHPYAATEIWYNPSTFQIVSNGHNGTTFAAPNIGLEDDDVNNFGQ